MSSCISHTVCCAGGFRQYDGLILPRLQVATGWLSTLTSYFTRSKSNLPSHDEAQQLALYEYLSNFQLTLIKCAVNDSSLTKCINNTFLIFEQLYIQKIYHGDSGVKEMGVTIAAHLQQVT